MGYTQEYVVEKKEEYERSLDNLVQRFDETKNDLLCVIKRDEIEDQPDDKKMLFIHILHNLDRIIENKLFFALQHYEEKRLHRRNSIGAITILNKIIFFLKDRFFCESHESIAHELGLKQYQETYNTACQTKAIYYSCLTEGINPGYTFYNNQKIDMLPNKILSLLSARLFKMVTQKPLIKIEIDKVIEKYPRSIIQDPEIIIALLEKIFHENNQQQINQILPTLQAFRNSYELIYFISTHKSLLITMKQEYDRFINLSLAGYEEYKEQASLLKKFIPEFFE